MSGGKPRSTQRDTRGTQGRASGRSVFSVSLVMLVAVDFVVAASLVASLLGFVLKPDPAVRMGPMLVALGFTTGSALLMLVLALNASFLPRIPRQRVPDLQLMMLGMGITGVMTGILAVGGAANSMVIRLLFGGIAYVFIRMQDTRRAQARAAAAAGRAAEPAPPPQPHARTRQRRGGRKR